MSILAIVGSARGDGHTWALLEAVLAGRTATRLDLCDTEIRPYEYGRAVEGDDFARVVDAIASHHVVVFATPVYWYAMSGRMKNLFDRFTDIVTVRKDIGRSLAGRTVFLLACGSDPQLPDGFEVPFHETATYLRMNYGGAFYAQTTKDLELSSMARVAAAAFGESMVTAPASQP